LIGDNTPYNAAGNGQYFELAEPPIRHPYLGEWLFENDVIILPARRIQQPQTDPVDF